MRHLLILSGLAGLFLGWNMPNHYPLWTAFHGELAAAAGMCLLFAGVVWPPPAAPAAATPGVGGHGGSVRVPLPLAARAWDVPELAKVDAASLFTNAFLPRAK